MAEDPGSAGRQVAVVDARGASAAHTGSSAIAVRRPRHRRRGLLPGEHDGVGDGVAGDAGRVRAAPAGSLTRRLLAALDAAEARGRRRPRSPVGGDSRRRRRAASGWQSVVVAARRGSPGAARRAAPARRPARRLRARERGRRAASTRAATTRRRGCSSGARRSRPTTTSCCSGPGWARRTRATSNAASRTSAPRSSCSRAGASCSSGMPPEVAPSAAVVLERLRE